MDRDLDFDADFPTDPVAHAEWLEAWEHRRKRQWEAEQAEAKDQAVMSTIYQDRERVRAAAAKAHRVMRQICAGLVANPYTEDGVPGTLRELVLRFAILFEQLDESEEAASAR